MWQKVLFWNDECIDSRHIYISNDYDYVVFEEIGSLEVWSLWPATQHWFTDGPQLDDDDDDDDGDDEWW